MGGSKVGRSGYWHGHRCAPEPFRRPHACIAPLTVHMRARACVCVCAHACAGMKFGLAMLAAEPVQPAAERGKKRQSEAASRQKDDDPPAENLPRRRERLAANEQVRIHPEGIHMHPYACTHAQPRTPPVALSTHAHIHAHMHTTRTVALSTRRAATSSLHRSRWSLKGSGSATSMSCATLQRTRATSR